MSSAVLTLLGLYSYDNTLFDGLTLPEPLDKDVAINTILMRGGDYEALYPNPVVLKQFIASWSVQKQAVFTNWNRALQDLGIVAPLENYDRLENWTDTGNETTHSTGNTTGTGETTGEDSSHGSANVTNNTTDTSKISADDVNDFVNKTQDISNNTQGNTTDTSASTSTNSSSATTSESNMTHNNTNTHGGRVHGNIGVTTSSTMYADWIKVVRDYGDIYDLIATLFLQDFVVPIL